MAPGSHESHGGRKISEGEESQKIWRGKDGLKNRYMLDGLTVKERKRYMESKIMWT